MAYSCEICGWDYETRAEAEACAAKGVRPNPLSVGDVISLPLRGFGKGKVVELLPVTLISHTPEVRITFESGSVIWHPAAAMLYRIISK